MTAPIIATGATFSPCGTFRYALERTWDVSGRPCAFVGFNPSTADALADDPTIRRCIGFARSWGFGSLVMLNLFAFRSTDPREIARQVDPIGVANDEIIRRAAIRAERIIAAWGDLAEPYRPRARAMLGTLWASARMGGVYRLGAATKSGHPRHPLYLPGSVELELCPPESLR